MTSEPCSSAQLSAACACKLTPKQLAVQTSKPCATKAAITPVSTSPMPPLLMPALPSVHKAVRPSGLAIMVPCPFSTITAEYFVANMMALLKRSACISAAVTPGPSSRAASAGCGVNTTGCLEKLICQSGSASKFNASASIIKGTVVSKACCSKSSPQPCRPKPGPIAITLACLISDCSSKPDSTPFAMTLGQRTSKAPKCSDLVAQVTKPEPQRAAASLAKITAPP